MLSAKEFYKLQKQGFITKADQSAVLVNSIKKNVENITQSVKDAASFLHPELRKTNAAPTSQVSSVTKKKRRKKRQSLAGRNTCSTDVNNANSLPIPGKINDAKEGSSKLSRRQRRRRKYALKSDGQVNTHSIKLIYDPNDKPKSDAKVNTIPEVGDQDAIDLKHVCTLNKQSKRTMNTSLDLSDTQEYVNCDEEDGDKVDEECAYSELNWDDLMDIQKRMDQEFASIISPLTPEAFFEKYFESNPLRIQRAKSHFMEFISSDVIDDILRQQRVMFTEHLDLAVYKNGRRETLNPPGRAFRSIVWDHYNTGCSVRLLSPQLFIPELASSLSLLQEYFGCFVGANLYLTPPGSQGFAPHYDDVEVFIIQLEGSKNWRVYRPRNSSEELPRFSSRNFTPEEIGEPTMTLTLDPGDLLYLPRGFIHQASTSGDRHSLHLTVSTYQRHTWGDLLEKLLPTALKSAMETDLDFRRGLPVNFLRHVGGFSAASGVQTAGTNAKEARLCEQKLRKGVVQLLRKLADQVEEAGARDKEEVKKKRTSSFVDSCLRAVDPLLVASDLMAVDLIHQSLPPKLDEVEATCHVTRQSDIWSDDNQQQQSSESPVVKAVKAVSELEPDTAVRLVRWSALRGVRTRLGSDIATGQDQSTLSAQGEPSGVGEEKRSLTDTNDEDEDDLFVAVYHSLSNTDVYKEHPLEEMALSVRHLPALDYLMKAFPNFVPIDSFPLPTIEEKMDAAVGLYEAGFLVTQHPLPVDDSDSDEDVEGASEASDTVTSDLGDKPTSTDTEECESSTGEESYGGLLQLNDANDSVSGDDDDVSDLWGEPTSTDTEEYESSTEEESFDGPFHLSYTDDIDDVDVKNLGHSQSGGKRLAICELQGTSRPKALKLIKPSDGSTGQSNAKRRRKRKRR